jgi:hypothetical protein
MIVLVAAVFVVVTIIPSYMESVHALGSNYIPVAHYKVAFGKYI